MHDEIQEIQNAHRLRLIDFWGIRRGSKILEIGCGQGDMTVALACATGEKGLVYGVDIAPASYGAPDTLGQAWDRILKTDLAGRVSVRFDFDLIKEADTFHEGEFDYIVLAHCLWYFSSLDELMRTLSIARKIGRNLLIAEWNPFITLPEQLHHYKAATIQAICESFRNSGFSNIRTMLYPNEIEKAVIKSGWHINRKGSVYSPDLQDGQWEVDAAIRDYENEINSISEMPEKLRNLLFSQIAEMKSVPEIKPMPVFCLSCT